jgi:hypothetical protein
MAPLMARLERSRGPGDMGRPERLRVSGKRSRLPTLQCFVKELFSDTTWNDMQALRHGLQMLNQPIRLMPEKTVPNRFITGNIRELRMSGARVS